MFVNDTNSKHMKEVIAYVSKVPNNQDNINTEEIVDIVKFIRCRGNSSTMCRQLKNALDTMFVNAMVDIVLEGCICICI